MPKFFVSDESINNNVVTITGENAHHISRSLRMAPGEEITVSDEKGMQYDCVLESFTDTCVYARIIKSYQSTSELPVRVHLYQALPKGEKLDLIIQKSVECGVYDITTFESERCIVKVKGDSEDRKLDRRNKIALEAAKQSGRGIVPHVNRTVSYREMLEIAGKHDAVFFCYEGDGTEPFGHRLKKLKAERTITDMAIIIGSEGGFSDVEATAAAEHGFIMTGLGKRILRTETAPLVALACVVYEFELS